MIIMSQRTRCCILLLVISWTIPLHWCRINAWLMNTDQFLTARPHRDAINALCFPCTNFHRITSEAIRVRLQSNLDDNSSNSSKGTPIDVVTSKYVDKPSRSGNRNVTIDFGSNDSNDNEDAMIAKIRDGKFVERNRHWVVLVDDEISIRQSVGDYLYDSGYQVSACADAYAFVELCRSMSTPVSNPNVPTDDSSTTTTTTTSMGICSPILNMIPSCIISDIRMPGGPDGIELLQWIRSSELLKRIPVVLLTAKGMTQDRIVGYQAGADAYISKPFDPDELLSIIDTVIIRQQQMTGTAGVLVDIQQEMATVKLLLQQNIQNTVQQTNVYLTPAAREILQLLCLGYTNGEIAIARNTTKPYVTKVLKRIYDDTGTSTRTELLRWAIQTGYFDPKQQ